MRAFWIRSGYALLEPDASGGLLVTNEFLAAYLQRPELAPVAESCEAERALHASLIHDPSQPVADARVAAMADADVQENWRLFLRFRDRLLAGPTLQAAYLKIFADASVSGRLDVPPLFVDQLCQIILHHLLVDCEDGLMLRVAELWFREQRVAIEDQRVVLADAEAVEQRSRDPSLSDLGRLLARGGIRGTGSAFDVIDRANAGDYFGRDERHDLAVEITHGRTASAMFCDLLRRWIGHLVGVPVRIATVAQIDDPRWRWHVGLDAQASALLDTLWRGESLEPEAARRLLLLMRLDFERLADQADDVRGKPVYLALAMDEEGLLRMKPQNVLFNLPVARQ